MGFIRENNVYVLEASLTFKGRKNFFNILDSNINKITYFTVSDTDIDYNIASQISNSTQLNNIPEQGFIPDFTGDYEICIKSSGKGVDESSIKYFLGQKQIMPKILYVWDKINVICQVNNNFSPNVVNGNHNTGVSLSKNLLKTIDGVFKSEYNISVPTNLTGDSLKLWLLNTLNTIEQIPSDNINTLVSGRTTNNIIGCPLDIDFNLTADQISNVTYNDTFISVLNITGGTGIYQVSVDNGLTYKTVTGNQYQFNSLPENQTRDVIVKDNQINPFSTKQAITTPSNLPVPPPVVTAVVSSFSAIPSFIPVNGGVTTLKISISQPVTDNAVFTLDNGQTITIPIGSTFGTVQYTVPNNSGSTISSIVVNITNCSNLNVSIPPINKAVTIIVDTWIDFSPQQYVCEHNDGSTGALNTSDARNTQKVLRKQHLNSDITQTRFVVDTTYPNQAVACPLPAVKPNISLNTNTNKVINSNDVSYTITLNSNIPVNGLNVRVSEQVYNTTTNTLISSTVLTYVFGINATTISRNFNYSRQPYDSVRIYSILDNNGTYNIIATPSSINITIPKLVSSGGSGSGGSGAGCLLAGQKVLIDNTYNTKLIEDIKVGDYVYTKHEFDNIFREYNVSQAFSLDVDNYYSITTIDDRNIKCSASHLFMVNNLKQRADELSLGDELMMLDGDTFKTVKLKSINIINEPTTVYKLEVEEAHTYITENLIYNHNKGQAPIE